MQFILLEGTHVEGVEQDIRTYVVGDTIETDKDLCAIFNKNGQPPRFEKVGD